MRIVAGRWRGRRIEAPPGAGVRPTLDRVREAWMSILQLQIPGARVLDLYSDRKSTRLNSSHSQISYAVFCLKKKKIKSEQNDRRLSILGELYTFFEFHYISNLFCFLS